MPHLRCRCIFCKGILGNKRYYKSKHSHTHKQKALSITVLPNLMAAKTESLGHLEKKTDK